MKNKLTDLNDHLFAQLERLNDENIKGDKLNEEIKRSEAITSVAKQVISNANTVLAAEELRMEYSGKTNLPGMIGHANS